jgi:hypothetical protein
MRKLTIAMTMGVLFAAVLNEMALGHTGSFQLEPSGVQIALFPGHSSTTGFLIKVGSTGTLREKLLLTLADWDFNRTGSVVYKEPGTTKRSASSWVTLHPVSLPVAPGDAKLVRIVVRIPDDAAPGVYTSAVLVTEKAPELTPGIPELPGAPPKVYCAFTILITVRPQEVH